MPRVFFALTPAGGERERLAHCIAAWAPRLEGQAVSASNLHVTLSFLGEVADESLPALLAAAAQVRAPPVSIRFDGFDYWPKPSVLCAVEMHPEPEAPASRLARRVDDAVSAAGFSPDHKPYRAHITLLRKINAQAAAACTWPVAMEEPFLLSCDRFELMTSRREEQRSIYSSIHSWVLDG